MLSPRVTSSRIPASVVESAKVFVTGQKTLEDVVRAGLSSRPLRSVVDVIVQDEYTHDVVVQLHDENYLVYDTT